MTFLSGLDKETMDELQGSLAELRNRLAQTLSRDIQGGERVYAFFADMRYKGQRHPTRVQITTTETAATIRRKFIDAYQRRYGRADEEGAVEFTALRATAVTMTDRPMLKGLHRAGTVEPAAPAYRPVYFPASGSYLQTPVYIRYTLPLGTEIHGPAIVEENGATTVIDPADILRVGALGELQISIAGTST
jgi:N-methylhydantoinase A